MFNQSTQLRDTPAWIFQVWVAFLVSLLLNCWGIVYLPVDNWTKGYMAMGFFFTTSSSFVLAKTIRDNQEGGRVLTHLAAQKIEKNPDGL